jgi:hypothetical protein
MSKCFHITCPKKGLSCELGESVGRPKYRGSLRSVMAWASRDRLEYALWQC